MKHKTVAARRKARRGRPPKEGVFREPSGRISRADDPPARTATEARARQLGLSVIDAMNPECHTWIGRLHMAYLAWKKRDDGKPQPNLSVSTAQYYASLSYSFLLLMALGRRHGAPTGLALATYIALGIGLHNLGEGLAIGAAFAAGAAGLGTFLVLGFTLHNITEGIGIAAPILKERPPLQNFVGLTLLAGGPAVVGLWIGSLAFAPQWSALALAIGAGAILQVIVEVTVLLRGGREGTPGALFSPAVIAGLVVGVGFMYLTAMLVKI